MIRPAEPRDADAIVAIWNLPIRESANTFNSQEKTPDDLIRSMIHKRDLGHAFLVAEEERAVVGFGLFGQFRAGVGYARSLEHTLYVAPEAQGRGVGRALMAALEEQARDIGGHSMMAGVSAENEAGVAFHQAVGFSEVARLPEVGWKFDRWIDLVLLQKLL